MRGRLGILVAGGSGERFGGPKALARFRGRTLVERAHDVLAAACGEVIVVVPPELELPVPARERVADRLANAGPLSALVAGLESRSFELAFALAVDLPRIESAHVTALLDAWRGELALVPAPAARLQPLAAVYAPGAVPKLAAALASGARALVPAVLALEPRRLDEAALAALGIPLEALDDADTRAELARIEGDDPR